MVLFNYFFTLFIVYFSNTLSAASINPALPQRSPELALTLTPDNSHPSFLREPANLATLRTQMHSLASEETIASVAKTYNMSHEALRKLNQFRTFARSFENLQTGDEIDVPLAPLPAVQWDDVPWTAAIITAR